MKQSLGRRIAALRKKKGLTQERLAEAVGVSAAAVSKWETEASQPDISLLCPLARALSTSVDKLLSFEEELPPKEMIDRVNVIGEMARKGELAEAEAALDKLLHTYPSSVALKFNAAGVMSVFQMFCPTAEKEKLEEWRKRQRRLLEEVRASGNPAYSQSAISQLAGFAVLDGKLEEAEALLKELPEISVDGTMEWAQLYKKKGEPHKALEVVQKRLYSLLRQAQNCMSLMMIDPDMIPDVHRQLEIGKVYRQMEELFRLGGGITEGFFVGLYGKLGLEEEERKSVIKMIYDAMGTFDVPNPTLFAPNVTIKEGENKVSKVLKQMLLKGLQEEESYEKYREDPEFLKALALLQKDVEEG